MIEEEARWLRRVLELRQPEHILDCGSSSVTYRESTQPQIAEMFRGFSVTHLDARPSPGVDLVIDLCQADQLPSFPLVICASVLEHVVDIDIAIRNVCNAANRDLLLTVPNRWPLHGGYDNGYRPTLGGLCQIVERSGLVVRHAELLEAGGAYAGRRINVPHATREDAR